MTTSTKKKGKSCKKGYGCGSACISVTYVCRKEFATGVSVSIDGMRTVIRNKIKAKPKSDGKLAKDVEGTIAEIDKLISKDNPLTAEQQLRELKYRIDKSEDPEKDKFKEIIDTQTKKIEEAKKDFKHKAEIKAEMDRAAKRDKKLIDSKKSLLKDRAAEVDDAVAEGDLSKAKDRIEDLKKVIGRDTRLSKEYKDNLLKSLDDKQKKIDKEAEAKSELEEKLKRVKAEAKKAAEVKIKEMEKEEEKIARDKERAQSKKTSAKEIEKEVLKKLSKEDKDLISELEKESNIEALRGKLVGKALIITKNVDYDGDRAKALKEDRLARDLTNASNAEDPIGFLKARRSMESFSKTLRDLEIGSEEYYIQMDKSKALKKLANARYFGEPDEVRALKPNPKAGKVDDTVPKTLPRGSNPKDYEPAPKEFKALLDEGIVLMQVDKVGLRGIMGDGYFKNGFQRVPTGTAKHGGGIYKNARKQAEADKMDMPKSAKAIDRPVYGYISHPDRTLSGSYDRVDHYGNIQIKFKNTVKEKSTVSLGDSLDDMAPNEKVIPVNDPVKPKKYATGGATVRDFTRSSSYGPTTIGYMEIQMFGKITTNEIEEIRIPKGIYSNSEINEMRNNGYNIKLIPPTMR